MVRQLTIIQCNAGHVLHNIDITKAGNFITKFIEFDKMHRLRTSIKTRQRMGG